MQIYRYNGKILLVDGNVAISENCCCDNPPPPTPPPFDGCDQGVYINGPTLTWEWTDFGGFGFWNIVGDFQDAIDTCNEFYNANNLQGGGPTPPNLIGQNFGDRVTVPSCLCGS